jgi:hypothetical protein
MNSVSAAKKVVMLLFVFWLNYRSLSLWLDLLCACVSTRWRNHNCVVINRLLTAFTDLLFQKWWSSLLSLNNLYLLFFSVLPVCMVAITGLTWSLLLQDCKVDSLGFWHTLLLVLTQVVLRRLLGNVQIGRRGSRSRSTNGQPWFRSHLQLLHTQLQSIRAWHAWVLVRRPERSRLHVIDGIAARRSIRIIRNHLFSVVVIKTSVPTWNVKSF